jgi:hypothetical protein
MTRFAAEPWISFGFDLGGRFQARAIEYASLRGAAHSVAERSECDPREMYELGAVLLIRPAIKPFVLLPSIEGAINRGLPLSLAALLSQSERTWWLDARPPRPLTGGVPVPPTQAPASDPGEPF